ncbi:MULTISPECIES: restriction endonuclease [unclassified Modestobacter]|uniref:restriction endonuclease n=1 Tax=unclassified Modestobacter TaxID=2643866 RepID=UPI0022AB3B56|nr:MULTISPECIES: restriction endonuclease [unclassified Modestobacter]MCZ2826086.1 restriction endonuclease [Modestobacter sp. VKM Ac-2981]MCZ2852849.1 restriction endonuclease [Modestobacter sp. VKM Ac-2982]
MASSTHGPQQWQQPPVHQISSWQDAEINAASWMRHWGHSDAAVTNGGADGGIDVRSERALAQVKYLAAAVGRPDLQRLGGVGLGEPGKQLFFFSGTDYTATALEYADATGMALFTYRLDGSMAPASSAARHVMRVSPHPQSVARAAPAGTAAPARIPLPVREPLGWKERWKAGGWYLGVPILSAGVFAAVPFWHAQARLNRPELRSLAVAYSVAGVAIMAVHGVTPKDAQGDPVGALGGILQTIAVLFALVVVIAACVKLTQVRREIFQRPGWESPVVDLHADQVTQARARRAQARSLWVNDPAAARELGIGRPDLGRGYDDGGLVDLNTAPAVVIASVCGVDPVLADAIVAARTRRSGVFYGLGEVLIDVAVPSSVEGELRERTVL